jgi:uncharacterized protein (DUF1499 family)
VIERIDWPEKKLHLRLALALAAGLAAAGIAAVALAVPPAQAFARARAAAQARGWEIVAADESAGRIEALATTRWFGFKDDIVIRVAAAGGGSRIDMRSKSRVGRSDLGANAKRIQDFLTEMRAGQ